MPLISQTAEYALRAVVHLSKSTLHDGQDSQTVSEIAESTQVPVGYLSKVLQQLTRAGIITSQRGIGGGFKLSYSPSSISIYDVVQAVDPVQRIRACPLGIEDHKRLCPLHRKLDAAMAHVEAAFKNTSIAELISSKTALCEIELIKNL
jgi:Rrf2 family protein